MADPKGFLKAKRSTSGYRPVCERVKDYQEVALVPKVARSHEQSSRCMDCGTPFCHWGCPVGNYIPEWNDALFHGRWEKAAALLTATNTLSEITGRLCPAPCEFSCVLGINDDPVTIRENELSIIEHGFKRGLVVARKPLKRTPFAVAVVGSGPAGLACAAQLNQAGHRVVVFERDGRIGGILRYGIPDFKLEKRILDRRIALMEEEGIEFCPGVAVGAAYPCEKLRREFAAVCLAAGSRVPRDLPIEGRDLKGIHFAMEYLIQSNKRISGERIDDGSLIDAKGKRVVVIGGGDTGADCVGTANRQGASCVAQIELLPTPPACRGSEAPWPKYPMLLKTTSSHEEGAERRWAVLTKKFIGTHGRVQKLSCVKVDFSSADPKGCPMMREVPGSGCEIEADLVILAMGFVHPEHAGPMEELRLARDGKGNVQTSSSYMTSEKGIFAAGDMRRGQSLVVWAIAEGRRAAYHIDTFLAGKSSLPVL